MTRTTDQESLTVVLELPDRQTLIDLLSTIEDSEQSVRTREIHRTDTADEQIRLDRSELTEKQLTALEIAVEAGYYERPREIDLTGLGERLGISKSAVSQRIRAAERTLIEGALRQ